MSRWVGEYLIDRSRILECMNNYTQQFKNEFRSMFSISIKTKLYDLDVKTQIMDPAWPITAEITPAIQINQQQVDLLKAKKRQLDLEIAGIVQRLVSPATTSESSTSSMSVTSSSVASIKQLTEGRTIAEPALKKLKPEKVDILIENKENVISRTIELSQGITHQAVGSQVKLSTSDGKSNWAALKANQLKPNELNSDSTRLILAETSSDTKNKSNLSRDIELRSSIIANSLKPRQQTNIDALYAGKSCSNCSIRFPPEQTTEYSRHLDWHFRENRRNRDQARRANSRGWYYDVPDWMKYEEIEDVSEREKSWFEIQQLQMDMAKNESAQSNESPVPSCIAGPDDVNKTCDMCNDLFETFFNDDDEEWHLRNALRMDKKTFHPICFEDYNKSSLDESHSKCNFDAPRVDNKTFDPIRFEDSRRSSLNESNATCDLDNDNANKLSMEVEPDVSDELFVVKKFFHSIYTDEYNKSTLKLDKLDVKCDVGLPDEDDDVILLPEEEPVIIEIPDDDEAPISFVNHTNSMSSTLTSFRNEADGRYESIGNDMDIQIFVPHTSVVDVENLEDKPIDSNSDVDGWLHNSDRIKEEPKDDGVVTFKDAETFEDIETFENIEVLEETTIVVDEDVCVPINTSTQSQQTTASLHQTITTLDGNVQWQSPPTTIGTNKIKINLKRNVIENEIKPSKSVDKQPLHFPSEKCKEMQSVKVADETSGLCSIM